MTIGQLPHMEDISSMIPYTQSTESTEARAKMLSEKFRLQAQIQAHYQRQMKIYI